VAANYLLFQGQDTSELTGSGGHELQLGTSRRRTIGKGEEFFLPLAERSIINTRCFTGLVT
jgi:hypothetical protein